MLEDMDTSFTGPFEIRTDDEAAELLTTATSVDQAFALVDALESQTREQLQRNGEGATDLWIRLVIDHDSEHVGYAAFGLTIPRHPRVN